jgi:hypothetical protein
MGIAFNFPTASASDLSCRAALRRAELVLLPAARRIVNLGPLGPGLASAADRRKESAAFSRCTRWSHTEPRK